MQRKVWCFIIISTLLFLTTQGAEKQPTTPESGPREPPQRKNYGEYKPRVLQEVVEPLVQLTGHVPPTLRAATQTSRKDPEEVVEFTIRLDFNNRKELDSLVKEVADPDHPNFQKFLTPEEFNQRFAPTEEQVAQAQAFLESHGLQSTEVHLPLIKASGKVADIETAFNTELANFEGRNGATFFAPSYEVQIPQGTSIVSVSGLDNQDVTLPEDNGVLGEEINEEGLEDGGLPRILPEGPVPRTVRPVDIRTAYDIPSELNCSGEVIGVVVFDGWTTSEISNYRTKFSIPTPNLEVISIAGATTTRKTYDVRSTAAIQLLIGMCPQATKIIVYVCTDTATDNWLAALTEISNPTAGARTLAPIVDVYLRYGEIEVTSAFLEAENDLFKRLAVQGQTVFAPAGDFTSFFPSGQYSVIGPASNPHVIAVGGTVLYSDSELGDLTTSPPANYVKEETSPGATGGYSMYWPIPEWQRGVVNKKSGANAMMRNVPDVAMNGYPDSGYIIRFMTSYFAFGSSMAAAHMWTAFLALVNQKRAMNGFPRLANVAKTLYKVGKKLQHEMFNDIYRGGNGYYDAMPGFDVVTGWGSFQGRALLQRLSSSLNP